MSPLLTTDSPAPWHTGELLAALSVCFVDELVDRPCRIAIEVHDGVIASTAVDPFEGTSRRIVVRTLEEVPTTLAPADLLAWVAAGNFVTAVPADTALADRDAAMSVGDFVELCAKASLEGRTVAGPDGAHHLQFSWFREPSRPVDRQAYLDLGVASGASRGPADAPVTIVSFLDIANPHGFDGKTVAVLSEVLATHAGVRVVVKLCPLSPAHELPAEAVYAAHAQGALWPMLECIAANLERLALDDLVDHAIALGLDAPQFRADLERHAFRDTIECDQDQMAAMEIDALPHALINGRRLHGALPAATYAAAIDRLH